MFYGGESNVPGAPGNLRASSIPRGPHTPLPSPGWNPGMNPAGSPGFRPSPLYEQILPDGRRVPFTQSLGPPLAFGSSNLPGAVGNMGGLANAQFFEGPQLGQAAPHGSPQRMQPREYLDQNMPAYPPGYGPPSKQPQPQSPEPFNPTQLELPLAMRGLQVPPGFQAKYVS